MIQSYKRGNAERVFAGLPRKVNGMFYIALTIVIIMNTVEFILMRTDKKRARHRGERIPERTLFICAWFFGALGGTIAMYLYHHKTKHLRFALGLPALFLLQVFVILLLFEKRIIRLPR